MTPVLSDTFSSVTVMLSWGFFPVYLAYRVVPSFLENFCGFLFSPYCLSQLVLVLNLWGDCIFFQCLCRLSLGFLASLTVLRCEWGWVVLKW